MTGPATYTPPITHELTVDEELAQSTFEALNQWRRINNNHHNEKRSSDRVAYEADLLIVFDRDAEEPGEPDQDRLVCFRTWGRDLSRGGVSFVVSRQLASNRPSLRGPQSLSAVKLIRVNTELFVGLPRGDGGWMWLKGSVRRVRQVNEMMFEAGIMFTGKLDRPPGVNDGSA